MAAGNRKKNSRLRASKTHGWGAMKKHRGAGNRGGRGMAGTGKRGDANKPSIWKDKKYFGKHGFTSIRKKLRSINLAYIENHINNIIADKKAKVEKDMIVIDLKDMMFDKLLGSGKITQKYLITCDFASKSSIEKIKSSGGEVILRNAKAE